MMKDDDHDDHDGDNSSLSQNFFSSTLHYIQIYNAPYMSIRKRIWSAAMAPERLHIAGFKQFNFKTVFKCQKRIS